MLPPNVLFPYDAREPYADSYLEQHRRAAARLGVTLVEAPLRTQAEARAALAAARKGEADGIFAPRSVSLNIPGFVLEATTRSAIPAMFHDATWVDRAGSRATRRTPTRSGVRRPAWWTGSSRAQDPRTSR